MQGQMAFDLFDYLQGVAHGKGRTEITSDMTFTDDGEGNITIEESE